MAACRASLWESNASVYVLALFVGTNLEVFPPNCYPTTWNYWKCFPPLYVNQQLWLQVKLRTSGCQCQPKAFFLSNCSEGKLLFFIWLLLKRTIYMEEFKISSGLLNIMPASSSCFVLYLTLVIFIKDKKHCKQLGFVAAQWCYSMKLKSKPGLDPHISLNWPHFSVINRVDLSQLREIPCTKDVRKERNGNSCFPVGFTRLL